MVFDFWSCLMRARLGGSLAVPSVAFGFWGFLVGRADPAQLIERFGEQIEEQL